MKRSLCILLYLLLQLISVRAESCVVLSGVDNTIVEGENKDKKQSVASISKIMITMIAVEHGQLDESSTVNGEINRAYESSAYPKQGQQVTIRDLLYGLMLRSGSDTAVEIAKHIAGSQEVFVELTNRKAAEIGMSNTTLSNPSGLDGEDGGDISTTNDMAVLMNYAMKSKKFWIITGSKYYTTDRSMCWKNKNRLLSDCPFTVGGKTGFIKKAGRTLVSVAEYDGVGDIVVTLWEGDNFAFREQKHTEVFRKMDVVTIIRKSDYTINGGEFHVPETLRVTLHKDDNDRLRVKTYYDHKDLVVKAQKSDDVDIYSFASEKVRGGGLFL